jgi:cellobiose phosphorylase
MSAPLWKFTDKKDGSFIVPDPDHTSALYFPLFNLAGMKCSITPEFKGDICTQFHNFLTIPQVTEDFHLTKASRNFWIYVKGQNPWSVTGVSAFQRAHHWDNQERATLQAGLGYFSLIRTHPTLGLKATSTAFVPATPDSLEIMIVEIENISRKIIRFVPTSASPIFARSADHLRDHRQVTSMFNTVYRHSFGVVVQPRMVHDEKGHKPNSTQYLTLGWDQNGQAPKKIWSNVMEFIGEGGSLDNPQAVYKNNNGSFLGKTLQNGVESMAALRFAPIALKPKQKQAYIILRGITENAATIKHWITAFGTLQKVKECLEQTKDFWKKTSDTLYFDTNNSETDNLLRWIALQPFCRKVYGNSYLPDHDYGRGGRGWRDLWSDCAALFLMEPKNIREDILNYLKGIRVDGTNATIIGTQPGEFVADRNNIVRTWSDHGTWPFFILNFYINQTGEYEILFQEIPYWKDAIIKRGQMRDFDWEDSEGFYQKDIHGEIYKGSVLEHVLLQQLSSFFNVGEHNHLLLEGADWNDTYDMAKDRGESVCFYNWIAWNLSLIADLCDQWSEKGIPEITLLSEIGLLLDQCPNQKVVRYNSWQEKRERLKEYFEKVKHTVSGQKVTISCQDLAKDLRTKAQSIYAHIRTNEYLRTKDGEHFFNGHYDNDALRVHGDHPKGVRMDLTSQVTAILSGSATDEQVRQTYHAILRYLRNPKTGGLRLCTDFKELKLNFGRVTGFVYGAREHGSIWSQQNAMLIYALYSRNFVKEGYAVYKELIQLCTRSNQAKVFPNLPSCFRLDGKGLSSYLTGSASWLLLGLVTQIFGVRGEQGHFVIQPKLVKEQFSKSKQLHLYCNFMEKPLKVTFSNPKSLDWGHYQIHQATFNDKPIPIKDSQKIIIPKTDFLKLCSQKLNEIFVSLWTV